VAYELLNQLVFRTGANIMQYLIFLLIMGVSFGYSEISARDRMRISRRLEEERMMNSVSRSILSETNMAKLIQNTLRLVGEFIDASRVIISTIDRENDVMSPIYYWSNQDKVNPVRVDGMVQLIDNTFPGTLPKDGEIPVVSCNDINREATGKYDPLKRAGMTAFIWTPIYVSGEFYGTLRIDDCTKNRRIWVKGDIALIRMVNGILSSAIARDLAERDSRLDPLTGLANRRKFNEHIQREWKRAIRAKYPITFMMLDIDKFKGYNDTYGHPQGDELLKAVANIFATSVRRPDDLAARLGGEEFGILLPYTSLKNSLIVAEKVRARVADMQVLTLTDHTVTTATVSIGVTSIVPGLEDEISDFLKRADEKLYAAKESGRNKVCW
jgi:diguanylate cyclase (GGDEF)-like protein